MQFIEGGPHIPDQLIEQLEDGNVVLFAGAGVSKNVGLPLFRELVKDVYRQLHQSMSTEEQREFKQENYDRTLGLFEARLGGGPQVREAVRAILTIPTDIELRLHKAILQLARTPDAAYRLVTTNFDRGFVMADPSVRFEVAPAVPLARPSRWFQPVHLHGLIDAEGRTLRDLVLTSADFGDAYIRSGWASRFVAELFERFTVLFIGYSVGDPVMRYLVDALAVSRSYGEHSTHVYALVALEAGDEKERRRQWTARGVQAIPYDLDASHSHLERTLLEWATLHKGGLGGRISVVTQLASNPAPSGVHDYQRAQLTWALSESSLSAARKFVNLSPPIAWLDALEQSGLLQLPQAVEKGQDWIGMSLQPVHPISGTLHQWLLAHLDTPELVARAIERSSILEWSFREQLHRKLCYTNVSLAEPYRQLWELVASPSVMNTFVDFHQKTSELITRLKGDGLDVIGLLEATDQLRPFAVLAQPTLRKLLDGVHSPPEDIRDLVDVDVELVARERTPELIDALKTRVMRDVSLLPHLLLRVQAHLERALTIFSAAGNADETVDPSIFHMSSLRHNPSDLYHWTALVVLLREVVILARNDRCLVRAAVEFWLKARYPVFLRLALFAMYECDAFEAAECYRVLLEFPTRFLWHYSNEEFLVPLIGRLWLRLSEPESTRLVTSVLEGPRRDMFPVETSSDRFDRYADQMRWKCLSAMEATGRPLSAPAAAKLASLRAGPFKGAELVPLSVMDDDVEDAYIGATVVGTENIDAFNALAIHAKVELVAQRAADNRRDLDLLRAWANHYPEDALDTLDTIATIQDDQSCIAIIEGLSSSDMTEPVLVSRAARLVPPLARAVRTHLIGTLTFWLERASDKVPLPDFLRTWDALMDVVGDSEWTDNGDAFTNAFSSPVGQLTLVLFKRWLTASPQRGSGLEPDISERVVRLLATAEPQLSRARIIIAGHLYMLHFVDQQWARSTLMPLFRWGGDACVDMWRGYLANARWYPDLLADIRSSLLSAVTNWHLLAESAKNLWKFFANVLSYSPSSVGDEDLQKGLAGLAQEALASLALAFAQIIRHSEASLRHNIWERGMGRALSLWPLDKELRSESLSVALVDVSILIADHFDTVFTVVKPFIVPIKDVTMILYELRSTTIPQNYPRELVQLLSSVIDQTMSRSYLSLQEHSALLLRMRSANSEVATLPEYHALLRTGWFEP